MKIILRAVWIVALCLSSGLTWAQQTLHVSFGCEADDGSTSTYEIWLYNDATPDSVLAKGWDTAQAFAESRDLRGELGHLATFEDATEEQCVLTQAAGLGLGTNQQLWIGLVQDGVSEPISEPDEGWGWVTGEDFDYVNWASNEPNNAGGNENHGTIGRYGYSLANGWNDEIATRGSLFGMVIEYDVAALGEVVLDCEEGEPCLIEIPSANPERNTITLPTGAGGTADIGVFLVQENCSAIDTLPIYDSREIPFGLLGETIPVANYLCADQWILISSKLEDVLIDEGVVEAEFEPGDFGLVSNGCAATLPSPLSDPLKTDLVTYLPASEQWGVPDTPMPPGPPTTSFPRSARWMQDSTYDCGSSRGRMKGNQYLGIGLNFYFQGESFGSNPDFVKSELISLTRKKLERLHEWVVDARERNVIKQGDFKKMEQKILGAIKDIDKFRFGKARNKIGNQFTKFLGRTKFNADNADGFNFEGEGIARSSNILFLLDFYLLPYFP